MLLPWTRPEIPNTDPTPQHQTLNPDPPNQVRRRVVQESSSEEADEEEEEEEEQFLAADDAKVETLIQPLNNKH